MEKSGGSAVCVTGGGGYIGSWLVRILLKKGYLVHATLRNLGDESKTELLKSFEGADQRLRLFEADLYDAKKFEPAIHGCTCVFLVATPLQHYEHSSQFKDTTEASISAVHSIMEACRRSKTVKRIIYTGSLFSASPLKEDGSGFKDSIDESCWTPLHVPFPSMFERDYTHSKTLTEKELLRNSCSDQEGGEIGVVSLLCGLVGGETLQAFVPGSMGVLLSPMTGEELPYRQMLLLQELLGSVPLVHVDDVCEAHVFCMENTSINGRFLCAATYPSVDRILAYFEHKYPTSMVIKESISSRIEIPCSSTKLIDLGFNYKFNMEQIIERSVQTAKRLGILQNSI